MFILKAYSTSADLQQGMKELHGMLSDYFFFYFHLHSNPQSSVDHLGRFNILWKLKLLPWSLISKEYRP